MRTPLIIGVMAALAVPVAAAAGDPAPNPNAPAAQCRAERSAMGSDNFKNTYGTNKNKSNAFGKCVSKQARSQDANESNAPQACRAEQADPNFASTHDGKTFAQFYGTNRNGRNAFGKCVSHVADAKTESQQDARLSAARACRAEQRMDPAAFRDKYGTNHNKRNAFGKCVAKGAHAS